jgi:methyl-accepting chemotaxis protein
MNIKKDIRILMILGIVVLSIYAAGLLFLRQTIDKGNATHANELLSERLSRETSTNSYNLTANVRSYVASGMSRFKDAYFEILAVRSGQKERPATSAVAPGVAIPLNKLYEQAGFTTQENAALQKANQLSGTLAELEVKAMEMVEKATPDTIVAARTEAIRILHDESYMKAAQDIQVPVGEFHRLLAERLNTANAEAAHNIDMTETGLYALTGVAGVMVFGSIWWLRKRVLGAIGIIARRLADSCAGLESATALIAQNSQGIADSMSSQASNLEETSSAIEEMSAMTKQNADNTRKTDENTRATISAIAAGSQAVNDMTQAMAAINDSSEKIGRIITFE